MHRALLAIGLALGVAGCGCSKTASPDTRNKIASLPENHHFDPHGWKVITSATDRTHQSTFMLYGNDVAVKAARAGQTPYPPGAVLSFVTWKSQEDDNWFGATVPGALQSVEQVTFGPAATYEKYEGPALTKAATDATTSDQRIAYITQQRASVMP